MRNIILGALLLSYSVVLICCQASRSATPREPNPSVSQEPASAGGARGGELRSSADVEPVTSRREARQFETHLVAHMEKVAGLTADSFRSSHRKQFLADHGIDVEKARFYDGFVKAFNLTDAERGRMNDLGFVVINSPAVRAHGPGSERGRGPADVYYRVFAADLPVFISADSILHAWHRSYDAILQASESELLFDTLNHVVRLTMSFLDLEDQAQRDAATYLAVARRLLDPRWQAPAVLADEVAAIEGLVLAEMPAEMAFMGQTQEVDFTQFIPRGHYTRTPRLRRYFQGMMWLGRTDLVLYDSDSAGPPNPREEAAARALAAALQRAGALDEYEQIDTFYRAHVGQPNALTPISLLSICDGAGQQGCVGDAAAMLDAYRAQGAPAYSGRLHDEDRFTVAMRFFPQRFGFDSWVTARTTTPELSTHRDGRHMASPFDVAFVLGSDRAAEHLAPDFALPHRENLPATLEALRQTFNEVPPTSMDDTIYNNWLTALSALAQSRVDEQYPSVMRTEAWHDRQLEAVLGSWTEMRHDTILIVEQSMGGIGCQYPEGYVEPVPELYRALARAAGRIMTAYDAPPSQLGELTQFVSSWQAAMERLARISEDELAHRDMSAEDLAFLNHTVDRHASGYGGSRSYDGWYPALFWTRYWTANPPSQSNNMMGGLPHAVAGRSEPIVADVHTDSDNAQVLEVGVGHPDMMLVAIDTENGPGIFAGPVYSFYSFHRPMNERMTDNQWRELVERGATPNRPAFAQRYRVQ